MRTDVILTRIQGQAAAEAFRVTQHAQEEIDAEEITLDEVLAAIANGQILEDYPEHRRGPCCLLYGRTFNQQLYGSLLRLKIVLCATCSEQRAG